MSFEPASPLSIIVCNQCQGKGCPACDNYGVYATVDEKTVAFKLPDFIDLKSRQRLQRLLLIKRGLLLACAGGLIIILRAIIYA